MLFWESGFENAASAGLSAGLNLEMGDPTKFPNPMLKQAFQTDIPRAELYALGMQGARMAYYRGGKFDWKALLIAALQAPVNQAIGDFSPQTEALQNKLQEPNWRVQIPSEFADSVISGAVYKHKLSWEDLEMDAADALGSYGGNFAAIEGYKQLIAYSQAMDQRAQTQWKNQSSQAKKAQANNPNSLDQLNATTQALNKESQKINDELAALGKINPFTGEPLDSGVTSGSNPSRVRQTQSGAPNDANNINKNPSYTNRQAQHATSENQAQAQSNAQQQQTNLAAKGSSKLSFWQSLENSVGDYLFKIEEKQRLFNDGRYGFKQDVSNLSPELQVEYYGGNNKYTHLGDKIAETGFVALATEGATGLGGKVGQLVSKLGLWSERSASLGDSSAKNAADLDSFLKAAEKFLGKDFSVTKPSKGSDLILRSKDGLRQVRFDITDSHGLDPHVNIETFAPRNLYPGDQRLTQIENLHVYPEPNLTEEDLDDITHSP